MFHSRSLLVAAALALSACGAGKDGGPGGPSPVECPAADLGSATPADLEAALTASLRTDAGLDALFGDRTQAILDQADALRLEASREAASEAGLPEPSEEEIQVGGLCAPKAGLTAAAWVYRQLGMAHAVANLPLVIDGIPFSGTIQGTGRGESTTGDPAVTATYNSFFEGNGKSEASVEVRGVVDIASPTKGSIHEDSEARVTIDVCPDANGHAKGKTHFKFGGIATPPVGDPWSYGATMDADFRFEVDDKAEIAGLVIDAGMTYRVTGSRASSIAGKGSLTFQGEKVTAADLGWDSKDGSLENIALVRREIFNAALMAAVVAQDKARSKWRDGTCVEIETDRDGGAVAPGEKIALVATAHQKLEDQDLSVDLQGWLEGSAELTPNVRPEPSPVHFEYRAGTADNEMGTVHLETISRRGIGRKDLTFTASPGRWSGTVSYTVNGTKTDEKSQWNADGTGYGSVEVREVDGSGSLRLEHDPRSAESGDLVASSGTVAYTERVTTDGTGTAKDVKVPNCLITQTRHATYVVEGTGDLAPGSSGSIAIDGSRGTLGVSGGNSTARAVITYETHTTFTASGGEGCRPPDPVDTYEERDGGPVSMVRLSPMVGDVDPQHPGSFSGSTTYTVPGTPDLEYSVSWNLQRQ